MRRPLAAAALAGGLLFATAVIESGRVIRPPEPSAPPEAVASVRDFLSLLRHFQASGGDPRFADRLPVTEAMGAEIRGGVEWERHLDELTYVEPKRVLVLSATVDRSGIATIRTREHSIARSRRRSAPAAQGPDRPIMETWEYRLVPDGSTWRIADWKPVASKDGPP